MKIGANFEIHLESKDGIGSMKVSGDAVSLLTGLETLIQQLNKGGIPKEKNRKNSKISIYDRKRKR